MTNFDPQCRSFFHLHLGKWLEIEGCMAIEFNLIASAFRTFGISGNFIPHQQPLYGFIGFTRGTRLLTRTYM